MPSWLPPVDSHPRTKRSLAAVLFLTGTLALYGCPGGNSPGTMADDTADAIADSAARDGILHEQTDLPEVPPELDATGLADSGSDPGSDSSGPQVDPLDSFFSLAAVHTIALQADSEAVASLVAEPKKYVHATVRVDDELYPDVGVRLKGSIGSFVPIDEVQAQGRRPGKSAFIIDFNRFAKGQDHLGLKKLTVNNMVQDPSGIHQYLGYALFREGGVPAARSGFATVSFNGNDKGLYALVESADNKEFLDHWFGSASGNLYEGEGSDLTLDSYAGFDQDRGDDTTKEDLRALAQALDAAQPDDTACDLLASLVDLDEYVTFAATEMYLAHWDGYAWNTSNFMLYHDIEGQRFVFLPWGIDQLFDEAGLLGPYHGIMKSAGPSWATPSRGFDSLMHGGRIQQVCYTSATCRKRLGEAFDEVVARAEAMGLAELAAQARALAEPYMLEEATQFGDPQWVVAALDQVEDFIGGRKADLEAWLPCLAGSPVDGDGDGFDGCTTDCDDALSSVHPGAPEACNLKDDDCNGILDDAPECPDCYDLSTPGGDYSLCFQPATWMDARARCQERGQDLASIHDETTNLMLPWDLLEKTGYAESWIGLNDIDVEGTPVWSDGSPYDFDYTLLTIPPEWGAWLDCTAYTLILGWLPQYCADERAFLCKSP